MRDVTPLCNPRGSSCPDLGISCPSGKELFCCEIPICPENQEPYQQVLVLALQICHILSYNTAKAKKKKKKDKTIAVTKTPSLIDVGELIHGTTSLASA